MHASEHDDVEVVDFVEDRVRKSPQEYSAHLFEHDLVQEGVASQNVCAGAEGTQEVAPETLLARIVPLRRLSYLRTGFTRR